MILRVTFPLPVEMNNARENLRPVIIHAGEYLMEKITNPITRKVSDEPWYVISGSLVGMTLSDFKILERDSKLTIPLRIIEVNRKAS